MPKGVYKRKRRGSYGCPKLIPFRQIKIEIPRKYILKRYYSEEFLTKKEIQKLVRFLRKIEGVQNKLAHLRSIVEKILLRIEGIGGRHL